jgi:hypothetical protein
MVHDERIKSLVEDINKAASASETDGSSQLLTAARELVRALEHDEDDIWKFVFAPAAHGCGLLAWQTGLLGPWPKETMTSGELSEKFGIDKILLGKSSIVGA